MKNLTPQVSNPYWKGWWINEEIGKICAHKYTKTKLRLGNHRIYHEQLSVEWINRRLRYHVVYIIVLSTLKLQYGNYQGE